MQIKPIVTAFTFITICFIISSLISDIIISNNVKPAIAQFKSFQSSSDLTTYSNDAYGIKIKVPYNWELEESESSPEDRVIKVVNAWAPLETHKDEWQEHFTIHVDPVPYAADLEKYLDETLDSYKELEDFKLIESNTNSMLFGYPAYSLVYTYTQFIEEENDEITFDIRAMEVGTLLDGIAYFITFWAEEDRYSDYIEPVQAIINSFEITNPPNLQTGGKESMNVQPLEYTYNNLGIEISFPSEWEISNQEESRLLIAPLDEVPIALFIDIMNIPDIENSFENEVTLKDNMYSIMDYIREDPSITNLRFIDSQFITLNGYSGFQLELDYEDNSLGELHEMAIYTAKGNTLYTITYLAEPTEYENYLASIMQIIGSFHITNPYGGEIPSLTQSSPESILLPPSEGQPWEGEIQTNDITSTNQELLIYENSFGMRMQYPISWEKNEEIDNTNSVSFTHPDGLSVILVDVYEYEKPLNQIIAETLSSYSTNLQDFIPIESKPITIAGKSNGDAHMLIYNYFYPDLGTMQAMEVFVVDGNLLYNFIYDTQMGKYTTHLHSVLNILKSIEFKDVSAINDTSPQEQLSPPAQLTPF